MLTEQLRAVLCEGMSIPEPIEKLHTWIEGRGYFIDNDGGRVGFLYPEDELRDGWTETERPGGTIIEFVAEGNGDLHYWFGHDGPEVIDRLCVFAQSGAEGSMAAFWLDDDGRQRIVHMGSGSGSTLVCVLADDAVDFLRLLAIGYDEICWNDCFASPPNSLGDGEMIVHPNVAFREWVTETFDVTIPTTADEIVTTPNEMDHDDPTDPFCRWVNEVAG